MPLLCPLPPSLAPWPSSHAPSYSLSVLTARPFPSPAVGACGSVVGIISGMFSAENQIRWAQRREILCRTSVQCIKDLFLNHWAEVGFSWSSCGAVSCSHGSVATWAGEDSSGGCWVLSMGMKSGAMGKGAIKVMPKSFPPSSSLIPAFAALCRPGRLRPPDPADVWGRGELPIS